MDAQARTTLVWNTLRFAYGAVLALAGLDKLVGTNFIADWSGYISPFVSAHLPVGTGVFLAGMGIVEIVVAIMLMTKWTRLGGYLSIAWLVLISINLLMLGLVDIAVRDVLLAVGAFALAELTVAVDDMRVKPQV